MIMAEDPQGMRCNWRIKKSRPSVSSPIVNLALRMTSIYTYNITLEPNKGSYTERDIQEKLTESEKPVPKAQIEEIIYDYCKPKPAVMKQRSGQK